MLPDNKIQVDFNASNLSLNGGLVFVGFMQESIARKVARLIPDYNELIETTPVVSTYATGIELDLADVSNLVVFSADSRAVHQGSYSAGNHQVPLKPGIYFVLLTDSKGAATHCKVSVL